MQQPYRTKNELKVSSHLPILGDMLLPTFSSLLQIHDVVLMLRLSVAHHLLVSMLLQTSPQLQQSVKLYTDSLRHIMMSSLCQHSTKTFTNMYNYMK